jgi:hypothetical protein
MLNGASPTTDETRWRRLSGLALGLALGMTPLLAQALDRGTDREPTADGRSPWRVFSMDLSGGPVGAIRWLPSVAAEPHPYLRSDGLPRMRPAISVSRGGPVVLSLVGRGDRGLLLTLQYRP